MRRVLVVLLACAAGGCSGPSVVASGPPAAPRSSVADAAASPCAGTELQVVLPAPVAGGPTAELEVERAGQGLALAARATCVAVGARRERIAPGARRTVRFAAHPRRLQRLVIHGTPLLAHVPPGARLRLRDNPCFSWELGSSAVRSPWSVAPPLAYCAAPGPAPCRPGFLRAAPPRPAEDPLCPADDGDAIRRCVAAAVVRLAAGADAAGAAPAAGLAPVAEGGEPVPVTALAGGRRLELYPRECGFARVATSREVVSLAVGVGDRWRLRVDAAGRLDGEVE